MRRLPSPVSSASARRCVTGARHTLEILLRRRAAGIGERFLQRRDVRAEDRLAVFFAPLVRAHERVERTLEARHHIAREQLIAAPGRLAAGPVVGTEQEAAEAAGAQLD